ETTRATAARRAIPGRRLRRPRLAPAGRQPAPGRTVPLEWPLEPAAGLAAAIDRAARADCQPRPGGATRLLAGTARVARCPARRLAAAPGRRPARRKHAAQRPGP